jgi:hypothetical protein
MLGISPDATAEEIQARWRELARRYHPDSQTGSVELFSPVAEAYAVLNDPVKREAYDFQQASYTLGAVNFIAQSDLPHLEEHFRYWKFRILYLDGADVFDSASFITRAYHDLPNPYGYEEGDNLDTFYEVLTDGLALLPDKHLVLIWTDVHNMLQRGLPDLLIIHGLLNDAVKYLQSAEPDRKHLIVVLTGEGANFPAWKS